MISLIKVLLPDIIILPAVPNFFKILIPKLSCEKLSGLQVIETKKWKRDAGFKYYSNQKPERPLAAKAVTGIDYTDWGNHRSVPRI
jgi:hypothetical protein